MKQDMKNIRIRNNTTNDIHITRKGFYGSLNDRVLIDCRVKALAVLLSYFNIIRKGNRLIGTFLYTNTNCSKPIF